jgi:hypothetical protein
MAWQRRNGRLVRGNDSTLVALPQRVRRRRARPKRNRLKALPADVAPQVFDFLSPCDAMRVAATASDAVDIARSGLEHLNTCAVDVTQSLNLMRSFVRVRAQLRSLTIHLGSQEVPMLRWLLESCDVTKLSRMRVKVCHGVPLLNLGAHLQLERTGTKVIDVTRQNDFPAPTLHDFHRLVSWTPAPRRRRPALQALRSLAVVAGDDEVLMQLGDALQSVEELKVTLPFTNRPARFPLTSQLPQLRTLKLSGGAGCDVSIESPSLRVIDLRSAAKHCFLRQLDCPSLTHLRVRNSDYGNGVRRMSREVIQMDEPDPSPPPHVVGWQDELDHLESISANPDGRIWELIGLINQHRWHGRVVVSVPAAGNAWFMPDRRNTHLPAARVTLPPACTVHFSWDDDSD